MRQSPLIRASTEQLTAREETQRGDEIAIICPHSRPGHQLTVLFAALFLLDINAKVTLRNVL